MHVTSQHVTFRQTDNLGEIVIDNPPLNIFDADMFAELPNAVGEAAASDREGRALAQSLAHGPTLAHTRTKRLIRAWRSGGVEAADALLPELAPAVMLSEDLQNTTRKLQSEGWSAVQTFHGR